MKVIKNLWAGYESYFVPMSANKNVTSGICVSFIDKWRMRNVAFYTHDLKDREHFPVVCDINLPQIIANEIEKALKERVSE